MILLLCLACAVATGVDAAAGDDTYAVTLHFQRMHCDECKRDAEATVKRIPGFVSVTFTETSAVVLVGDKSPIPAVAGLPKDMGYKGASLSIHGTVSFSGDKATLVAKGSGATLPLTGAEKLAELKKKLGGKNRFQVTGGLAGKSLQLESFQAADWKD